MVEALFEMSRCLEGVKRHDDEAVRLLLEHLYPLVIKIVRAHLPRRTDEQDLAQVIFVKMFTHLHQFSGTVPFEHWVSRIAVNTCVNQLRAEKSRPELRWADLNEEEASVLDKVLTSSEAPAPSEQLATRELVEKLLGRLSPPDRLVIQLLDLEERSIQEIRALTGWSTSKIKVRAFRARLKLKKELARMRSCREL